MSEISHVNSAHQLSNHFALASKNEAPHRLQPLPDAQEVAAALIELNEAARAAKSDAVIYRGFRRTSGNLVDIIA